MNAFVFFMLSVADLLLSLKGFEMGATEANPFMAIAVNTGTFIPVKLTLSLILSIIILIIDKRKVNIFAISFMCGVVIYHIWGLYGLYRV